ncbi:MAG: hypothetical protein ACK2T3_08800, partial [Candidatus Promineifilaceae bacterium]
TNRAHVQQRNRQEIMEVGGSTSEEILLTGAFSFVTIFTSLGALPNNEVDNLATGEVCRIAV